MADEAQKSNLLKRFTTGMIAGFSCLFCILLGGIPLYLLILAFVVISGREYVQILQHKGFHPSFGVISTAGITFATLIFLHKFDLLPFFVCIAIIASFLIVLFKGRQPYIANVATTVLGFMYTGWLIGHVLLIRQIGADGIGVFKINTNAGISLLVFSFLAIIATDVFAYYAGMKFGKTKLAPTISPKKTVEGAIGGGLASIIICCFGVLYTNLSLLQCIIAGLLLTIFAQLGDLSESLIKRDAGVKDSSDILPGHGGFLDRTDGYIFALPVIYYYFICFTQGNNIFFEFINIIKGMF